MTTNTPQQAPSMLARFYDFLGRPLFGPARVVLALLVVPLVLSFTAPLWRISMTAPQYPKGLYMDIYAYKLVGGNEGQDINEINTLNHYIGMHHLDRTAAADLDWIPFALGALVLLALRAAVIGNVRDLVDLLVVTGYVSVFALCRFVYRLWVFGHDLDPHAPVKVAPFLPVVIGHKTVANFETYSWPQMGTYMMGIFATGVAGLVLWHLIVGRVRAVRAARGLTTAAAAAVVALVLGVGAAARADGSARTTLQLSTQVAADQDACLDHTVKELGMSAKRPDPKVRRWVVGPQFLHPAIVPDGTITIELAASTVRLAVSWPGGTKEPAVESDVEGRATAVVGKMAQMCGVARAAVTCTVIAPGKPAAACTP